MASVGKVRVSGIEELDTSCTRVHGPQWGLDSAEVDIILELGVGNESGGRYG